MDYKPNLVLMDSDFIFALFTLDDSNNSKAKGLLEQIKINNLEVAVSNLVKQEVATLFSKRCDQKTAIQVVEILENFETLNITPEIEIQIWSLFKSFQKKNISFIDCSNLFLAQKYNCKIASFDSFYPKEILLNLSD